MRIVQLLNWDLKSIKNIVKDIKNQGFDAIQINPMQPFKKCDEFNWWASYQPLDFKIGNAFGSKKDLIELCEEANKEGISIIVDVVANHTANLSGEDELSPHTAVAKRLKNNKNFWKEKIMITDGDDRFDAVKHLIGLPGLNLNDLRLIRIVLKYLQELIDCGVKGFRFDAAKHIGLPSDGIIFFNEIKKFLKGKDIITYGEFLGGNKVWQEEFASYLPILCPFTTTIDNLDREVTFIESHDSFLNDWDDSTKKFKSNELINLQGLLNNKFNNTLYYVRPIYKPYNPNGPTLDKKKATTVDYFEQYFLDDKRFKEINNQKKLVLK